jgi:hypothetical protein
LVSLSCFYFRKKNNVFIEHRSFFEGVFVLGWLMIYLEGNYQISKEVLDLVASINKITMTISYM